MDAMKLFSRAPRERMEEMKGWNETLESENGFAFFSFSSPSSFPSSLEHLLLFFLPAVGFFLSRASNLLVEALTFPQ